jgi:hypothetical protein
MFNTKLYIRINENKEIIHAFTTDFEQPQDGDILYMENCARHVGESAPELANLTDMMTMERRLSWDAKAKKIIVRTEAEMKASAGYIARRDAAEAERLIAEKIRAQAVAELVAEGKLTADGKLKK